MRLWFATLALAAALPALAQVSTSVQITGEVQRELALGVDVLREVGIREDARHALRRTYVIATATDGFKAVFSWGELFNTPIGRGVLVAFERDGAPLREGEGRITVVSLGDERPGTRHVKWLARIEVRRVPE